MNIDWSIHVRLWTSRIGSLVAPMVLTGNRMQRFEALDDAVVVRDLRKGIPADNDSVDGVYHSHVLEHIDAEKVPAFLAETWRVLRPGGVQRVVVPDLAPLCREYVTHLDACKGGLDCPTDHDSFVAALIEQSVRIEADGTSRQSRPRRLLENVMLGDARKRGETHQWMYDNVSLSATLHAAGFREIRVVDCRTSRIPEWDDIDLDRNGDGSEYKPGSLYVESVK